MIVILYFHIYVIAVLLYLIILLISKLEKN